MQAFIECDRYMFLHRRGCKTKKGLGYGRKELVKCVSIQAHAAYTVVRG